MKPSWTLDAVGPNEVRSAIHQVNCEKLATALAVEPSASQKKVASGDEFLFLSGALEIEVVDRLEEEGELDSLRFAAWTAYQLRAGLELPNSPIECAQELLHRSCLGVLADRASDSRRLLLDNTWPQLPLTSPDWGTRVWATILEVWLRILRKGGWEDFDHVQQLVIGLRKAQSQVEPGYLRDSKPKEVSQVAWSLVTCYHLAKCAEILAIFTTQGESDGRFDIAEQLDRQFDRALSACQKGGLTEHELRVRILSRVARCLVDNSLWTLVRGQPSVMKSFVRSLTAQARTVPIFEALPPQRQALREHGLLGSGHQAIIVSLPTSSGKTLIAEFRILSALNQFSEERGWVAYVAPTRALVNQIAVRLRRDFSPLDIIVEKVGPALEIDGAESSILMESEPGLQFRVLISTPEKLDLMLRGGWVERIGRPLTLVVVDEAHNLSEPNRGLRFELLLALIKRECQFAKFLLLTPFVPNSKEIVQWLSPQSNESVSVEMDWTPNDRAILLASPFEAKDVKKGAFGLIFRTLHTSKPGIEVVGDFVTAPGRSLGLTYSKVRGGPGRLAAAVADKISQRGTVILLTGKPDSTWPLARLFLKDSDLVQNPLSAEGVRLLEYFKNEYGEEFPLAELLSQGIGVHHAGLSDEARAIVEWLAERGQLKVLVATTTLAQGVNFPVTGVVFSTYFYPTRTGSVEMPAEDFWNIAGRAGRVDHGELGLIALVGATEETRSKVQRFVSKNVGELNSTLLEMVQTWFSRTPHLSLKQLSNQPEWSGFLQYLAHTYRQLGSHERFVEEIELVLRGTLGFQALRKSHSGWAKKLIAEVRNYAVGLNGQPLALVDSTGFSWESVAKTLAKLNDARLREDVWNISLYDKRQGALAKMMGILLQVPELRDNLAGVGGSGRDGEFLANVLRDWVHGASLSSIAESYFSRAKNGKKLDATDSMTQCCRSVFGKLTQTASWGLSALQALTWQEKFAKLPPEEQLKLRNIPAKAYYGVSDDAALTLRLLGVPRQAATPLAKTMNVKPGEPLPALRQRLRDEGGQVWEHAMGKLGKAYHNAWQILEGEERPRAGAKAPS